MDIAQHAERIETIASHSTTRFDELVNEKLAEGYALLSSVTIVADDDGQRLFVTVGKLLTEVDAHRRQLMAAADYMEPSQ